MLSGAKSVFLVLHDVHVVSGASVWDEVCDVCAFHLAIVWVMFRMWRAAKTALL